MVHGKIANCSWQVAIQCPQTWYALDRTDDPDVRRCSTCLQDVYRCDTEDEVRRHVAAGHCCAIGADEEGEFLGVLVEIEPER